MNGTSINLMKTLLFAWVLALLSACGSSSTNIVELDPPEDDDHHHDDHHHHDDEGTKGRLLISHKDEATVFAFDLDEESVLESFTLTDVANALYPAPGNRYGLIVQRNANLVNAIDGGVWEEDHGDHMHAYAQAPNFMHFELQETRPTHFTSTSSQAVFFFDGFGDESLPAAVAVLTESNIASDSGVVWLHYETHQHGAAQARGEYLLSTVRDPADTSTTLPDRVALYHAHGDHFDWEETFEETCPGLHGSAQNHHHIAFGCTDGVLVIDQHDDEFTAFKVPNPNGFEGRIGTLYGHHNLDVFVGIAAGKLYEVNPEAGTVEPIVWTDDDHLAAVGYAFAEDGHLFVILDDHGGLTLLDAEHHWEVEGHIQVTSSDAHDMPSGSRFEMAVSQASHFVYVLDPIAREVLEVDLEDGDVHTVLSLDFIPHKITWLGIAGGYDHDHHHHDH